MYKTHWQYEIRPFDRTLYFSFGEYVGMQLEIMCDTLQEAAEAFWDSLPGENLAADGAEMQRWWTRHFRSLRERLVKERHEQKLERVERRQHRAEDRLAAVEEERNGFEEQLDQAKLDLEIEKGLTEQLRGLLEQARCRECNQEIWESYNP